MRPYSCQGDSSAYVETPASLIGIEEWVEGTVGAACVVVPIPCLQEPLTSREEASFEGGSRERFRQFAAGRTAARAAMVKLGLPPVPLPRGNHGEPVWPAGVVGSISHTREICGCVVALAGEHPSIGMDIEEIERVTPLVSRRVMTAKEQARLEALTYRELQERLALTFSAKEAYFKFQYPLTRRFVGFLQVELEPLERGFCIVPLEPQLPPARGDFCFANGLVFTVVYQREQEGFSLTPGHGCIKGSPRLQ